jgi:hypothetical protein
MRSRTLFAALAAIAVSVPAAAQSIGDATAYSALTLSPVGGVQMAPLMGGKADTQLSFSIRYGATDAAGGAIHRAAASFAMEAGPGQFGVTAGVGFCDGCTSLTLIGVDWLAPLTTSDFRVGIRPAIGTAISNRSGGGTYYAGAVSLPLSWVDPNATGFRFVPFLEPGFGYGTYSASGISEQHGSRAMLGGGLALLPNDAGYTIVVSAKQVFINGANVTYGIGGSFAIAR